MIDNQPKPVEAGGFETPTQECPKRKLSYPSLRWIRTYTFRLWVSRGAVIEPVPSENIRPSLGNPSGPSCA